MVRAVLVCVCVAGALALHFHGARVAYAAPPPSSFFRELSVGMYGEDVRALQHILNLDESTRIRGSGAGSPGKETQYFGGLTRDALVRFQEKYRRDILTPFGLVSGTGRANWRTLAVLVRVRSTLQGSGASQAVKGVVASSSRDTLTQKEPAKTSSQGVFDPNRESRIAMIAAVEYVARKQGKTNKEIAHLKELVTKSMATSTDLKRAFEDLVRKTSAKYKKVSRSGFPAFFARVAGFLGELFMPEQAYAGLGTPFGGHLKAAVPCACSDTWLITLAPPLPPSFVVLLSYIPETQLFLYENIPMTSELLGFYEPGAGICLEPGTPCEPIPNEGLISPFVGSSMMGFTDP